MTARCRAPRPRGRAPWPASTTSTSSRIRATSICTSRSPARTGGPILELAAGTGRLAVPLAEAGHDVTGGRSRPGDARAGAPPRSRRAGVGRVGRLDARRGATCSTSTCPTPASFALAFIALNSLFLLATRDRQRAALRVLAAHLAPRRPGRRRRLAAGRRRPRPVRRPADLRVRADRPRDRPRTSRRSRRPATTRRPAVVDLTSIYEEGAPGDARRSAGSAATRSASSAPTSCGRWPRTPGSSSRSSAGGYDLDPLRSGQRPGDPRGPQAVTTPLRTADRPTGTSGPDAAAGRLATLGRDGIQRPDAPPARRGRPAGGAVHPRPPQLAELGQAARRPERRQQGPAPGPAAPARTSSSSTPCSRAGSRACRSPSRSPTSGYGVPVIVLTVPQNPVEVDPAEGHPRRPRDAVLGLRPDEPDRPGPQGLRPAHRRPARRGSTRSSPRRAASARRRSRSTSRSRSARPSSGPS